MRKQTLLAFAVMFAVLVTTACATSPTGRPQLLIGSKRELEEAGRRDFIEFKKNAPLSGHGPTIEYVTCVTNHVLDQLPDEEFDSRDWELVIADVPQTNAFVVPGGRIVVFTGILSAARNQHQLAAVLGHEVAHEIALHGLERKSNQTVASYGIQVLGSAVGGGTSYNAKRASFEAFGLLAQYGFQLPFSRKHESEADIVGLRYMAMAGFDPRESVPLWKNMASGNQELPPELLMTHPAPETRIRQLVEELEFALPLYNDARARGADPQCEPPGFYSDSEDANGDQPPEPEVTADAQSSAKETLNAAL
ncbi:MAG: M48 family metallopeptidase [Pseudomonadota bacterium]